jgi:hypothetical protein
MFEGIDQIVEVAAIGLVQAHEIWCALPLCSPQQFTSFRLILVMAGHPDNPAWQRCVDDIEYLIEPHGL